LFRSGDFYDGKSGILAGAWSRLATVRKSTSTLGAGGAGVILGAWSQRAGLNSEKTALADHADWLSGRDVTSLQILGKKSVAVGQGGLVLSSVSGGGARGGAAESLSPPGPADPPLFPLCSGQGRRGVVGPPRPRPWRAAPPGR